MMEISQSGNRRFLQWVILTVVFWCLGSMLGNFLWQTLSWLFGMDSFAMVLPLGFSSPEPRPFITSNLIQGLLVGTFIGFWVGFGQWIIIRKLLPRRAGWWMLVTAVGKGLGVAAGTVLAAVVTLALTRPAPSDPLSSLYTTWRWFGMAGNLIRPCGSALGYFLGGIGQWFILRGSGRTKAKKWLAAVGLGGICTVFVSFIASMVAPLVSMILFSYSEQNGTVIYKGLLAGRDTNHSIFILFSLLEEVIIIAVTSGVAAYFTGWELFRRPAIMKSTPTYENGSDRAFF